MSRELHEQTKRECVENRGKEIKYDFSGIKEFQRYTSILNDPSALLWYILKPDTTGDERIKKDKESLWCVVDGKHDMDDSEKRKLNIMKFIIEYLMDPDSFLFDGMYTQDDKYKQYRSLFCGYMKTMKQQGVPFLTSLFDRALSRINPRYDSVRMNKNRVGDIKDALHERFRITHLFRPSPNTKILSEAHTDYPQFCYSDFSAKFDASFIENLPWNDPNGSSFSSTVNDIKLTLTKREHITGEITFLTSKDDFFTLDGQDKNYATIHKIHIISARGNEQGAVREARDMIKGASEFESEMFPSTLSELEDFPFYQSLYRFPRNGVTLTRIRTFIRQWGGTIRAEVNKNFPGKKPVITDAELALFIIMKNNSFAIKNDDGERDKKRFDNQRRSRKGNPELALVEQKTHPNGMMLVDYIKKYYKLKISDRKVHRNFFFSNWYTKTFSALDSVLQLNEQSDILFGRRGVENNYGLFLDYISQIEFTIQGGSNEDAVAGISAFTKDCFRTIDKREDTIRSVSKGPRLLRDLNGDFEVYCYKKGLSWAQAYCFAIALAFDNGYKRYLLGSVNQDNVSDMLTDIMADMFKFAVHVKSFADFSMGNAAKSLHGQPRVLEYGQPLDNGYSYNTNDSTSIVGLLQAGVDVIKFGTDKVLRFEPYSGARTKIRSTIRKKWTIQKLKKMIERMSPK